jgi:amino acid adenylation domain-containing protein
MSRALRPLDRSFELFPSSALDGTIIDRFDAVVGRFPERLAVSDGHRQLTYAELADLAGRIAATVFQAAAGRPGPIAILLARNAQFPAAMLGVLATGRGYVPLDVSNPIARNELIATQSGAAALLSAGDLAASIRALFPPGLPIVDIDTLSAVPGETSAPPPGPDDLACIIYTSGSTGTPKGVCHSHRNLLHVVMHRANALHVNPEDRTALVYSPSVIAGIREILTTLLSGASLHILPPQELQPAGLVREIRARGITICRLVPTLLRRIAEALGPDQRLDSVRVFGLGGERVDWSDFDTFRSLSAPEALMHTGIGPTECGGQFSDWFVDDRVRATSPRLPIGRPRPDVKVMVVNEDGRPMADGEIGEIVIASRYVALGYWRDPNLTARAFKTDPADQETRIFKTGDFGRQRPDGLMEFVGRKDEQIKLHGHRIEIGEIESTLRGFAGVRDAAVVVRRNDTGLPRSLAGYVEPGVGAELLTRDLMARLAKRLPPYMLPASVSVLEEIPRLSTLKIDRTRLAEIDTSRVAELAADNALVDEVIKVFESVIGTSGATLQDNTSSLGGDSLQVIKIALELERRFGIAMDSESFDASRTIRELTCWIASRRQATPP